MPALEECRYVSLWKSKGTRGGQPISKRLPVVEQEKVLPRETKMIKGLQHLSQEARRKHLALFNNKKMIKGEI